MIQLHDPQPAVADARASQLYAGLITPERVRRILTAIADDTPDGYPSECIGASPASGLSALQEDEHGNVLPPEPRGPITPTERAALDARRRDAAATARNDIAAALQRLRHAYANVEARLLYNEREWGVTAATAPLSAAEKRGITCEWGRCHELADLEPDTGRARIVPLAGGMDMALCLKHRAEAMRCDEPGCTNEAEKGTHVPDRYACGRPRLVTVEGVELKLCSKHRKSLAELKVA